MTGKIAKYTLIFICTLIMAITLMCCEDLGEKLNNYLFPEASGNTLNGTWEGIFYIDDNEEGPYSNEELIGIFEIIQDDNKLSGTAEIKALNSIINLDNNNDTTWKLTGSNEDYQVNITLTISFISFFDSEITWIIISSGTANEDLNEITGTWNFEALDLNGTYTLAKEEN